ncbi:hypothetical protein KY290_030083 [Solanum tuberosum]|uniref:Uncharacterized protein n=1 Tax=Solanum tuberosum TaxID=4113 RepID=A0ABQ7UMJ1_SOLTU|nr:hypothetical protein KY290_030083 [Solanum tuberosum]
MKWVEHHGDRAGYDDTTMGEPIAPNLRAMFELRVPIIKIVTNEGGSGKTLAIRCANKWLILENSAFYVARRQVMNHVGIEAVASDFNGNRALSSLDVEGCSEERSLRLGSLPKLLQQTKGDILIKSLTIDESRGTIFNVDKSTSEKSTSYSSATPENHDILD